MSRDFVEGDVVKWIGENLRCQGHPLISTGDVRKIVGVNGQDGIWLEGRDGKGLFGQTKAENLELVKPAPI